MNDPDAGSAATVRSIHLRKRAGVALMVGGLLFGMVGAGLWESRWFGMLGIAVSLAGWTLFSLAHPADRPPKKRNR